MGVDIIYDRERKIATIYCSTTGRAFGTIFHDDQVEGHSAEELAEKFIGWAKNRVKDIREVHLWDEYEKLQQEFLKELQAVNR